MMLKLDEPDIMIGIEERARDLIDALPIVDAAALSGSGCLHDCCDAELSQDAPTL